jgi:hypothetical protein
MRRFLFTITLLLNILVFGGVLLFPLWFGLLSYFNSLPYESFLNFDNEAIFISILSFLNIFFLSEIHKRYQDKDLVINALKDQIKYIEMLEFQLKEKDFLEKVGAKIDEHKIRSILVLHDIEVYKNLLKEYENEK